MKSKPKLTVADVLAGRTPAAVRDKVYITARVTVIEESHIDVNISSSDPVVWLNDKYRREYGRPDDLLVPNMQAGLTRKQYPELYLLSAGVFLWAGGKLVLLKKDAKAPTCAGCLTEPAGRCDALPGRTAMRELNEELFVFSEEWDVEERTVSPVALAWMCDAYIDSKSVEQIKLRQLATRSPHLVAIEYVGLDRAIHAPQVTGEDSEFTRIVDVYLDGVFMETLAGPHFLDLDNNTLEVRLALDLRHANLSHCTYQDGEEYGREVQLLTVHELSQERLLAPCLDHYVRLFQQASVFADGENLIAAERQSVREAKNEPETLREDERQRCEVWTRVMGYHRPTAEFNEGKKAEFAERVFFRESLIPPATSTELPVSSPVSTGLTESPSSTQPDCGGYARPGIFKTEQPFRIYMAGPLFSLAERNHNVVLAAALMQQMPGAVCVLPQRRAETLLPDLAAVSADCVEQASTCDVLVACLDGSDVDSGTCMEIVHARTHGRPVIGYRTDFRGSEVEGVNAMVRYGVDAYVYLPAYETSIEALADRLASEVARVCKKARASESPNN